MTFHDRGLLDWLQAPDPARGGQITRDGVEWSHMSYQDLAHTVRRYAACLRDHGVLEHQIVPIILPAGADFIAAFYATLVIGAVPAPIAPPMVFQRRDAFRHHLGTLLAICDAPLLVTDLALVQQIGLHEFAVEMLTTEAMADTTDLADVPLAAPGHLGLLQFTSGSSGHIRGVQVPLRSLEANVNAIRRWTECTSDDSGASWLPMHHDMGLIGNLLVAVCTGMSWWLMLPEHFIADPLRWLRLYGEHGACFGAAPNFGLSYITRRVQPADLAGMDFSGWRALVCGAERVDRDTIEEFTALLEPFGFDRRAILPAYGLAEATLAVTGKPLHADPRTLRIGGAQRIGGAVELSTDEQRTDLQWLVGCGTTVDEQGTVAIVDDEGNELPTAHVGEIVVEGPSVTDGYAPGSSDNSTTHFQDGRLFTGDAGFLLDGELFVIGRFGDSLKIRGKSVFAEDVDGLLHQVECLGPHNAVSLLGLRDGQETILAVVEQPEGDDWLGQAVANLRALSTDVRLQILTVPAGTIKRTTSGKPRRRSMWSALAEDETEPAYDSTQTVGA
jgi:acyl-CoA synthetase (AMP-forming)/AMP-acid ligase II